MVFYNAQNWIQRKNQFRKFQITVLKTPKRRPQHQYQSKRTGVKGVSGWSNWYLVERHGLPRRCRPSWSAICQYTTVITCSIGACGIGAWGGQSTRLLGVVSLPGCLGQSAKMWVGESHKRHACICPAYDTISGFLQLPKEIYDGMLFWISISTLTIPVFIPFHVGSDLS